MNYRHRRAFRAVVAALAALTFSVISLYGIVLDQDGDIRQQGQTANSNATKADEALRLAKQNEAGLLEANRRLAAAGKPTVPVPTVTVQPPDRVDTSDGLTADDLATIRQVAADEVARAKAPISQAEITQIARVAATFVPKPKDGKSVTVAELQPLVTVALATYCTNDRCVGSDGKDGANGNDGDDGEPGKDAPKVTDEQLRPLIAASLASYCGQESKPCDGKVGAAGADGKDGVGVADTDCVGDDAASYWRITYTNGTEGQSRGPCRIGPETPAPSNARPK